MKRLTQVEEEIMQHIWALKSCSVQDIIEALEQDPKPPHSTISSVVRILERKGYVDHRSEGRTFVYFPIIQKEEYRRGSLDKLIGNYFGGSASNLLSFLVKKEKLSEEDILDLQKKLREHNRNKDQS